MHLNTHFGSKRQGFLTSGGFLVWKGKLTIPHECHYRLWGLSIGNSFVGLIRKIAAEQEPLGAEFESVWDENTDSLYEK